MRLQLSFVLFGLFPGLELINNENSRIGTLFFVEAEWIWLVNQGLNGTFNNMNFYGSHWYHNELPNSFARSVDLSAPDFHPISTESMFKLDRKETNNDFLGSWSVGEEYGYTEKFILFILK